MNGQQKRTGRERRQNALTLVELLVVLGIIGVLVAILLPAVQASRSAARKLSCKNNLKQLGLGLHGYFGAHGILPCSSQDREWISESGEWSWGARVLPFIERNSLYAQCHFDLWPAEEPNRQVVQTLLPTFRCPSEATDRYQSADVWDGFDWVNINLPNDNYGLNEQLDAFNPRGTECWRFADIRDGLSKTIMVAETTPFAVSEEPDSQWYWHFTWACSISAREGNSIERDFWATVDCMGMTQPAEQDWNYLSSYHPGGAQFVLCDASVRFVGVGIDEETLRRLATPNDGAPIGNY